jgi:hypothetical protein
MVDGGFAARAKECLTDDRHHQPRGGFEGSIRRMAKHHVGRSALCSAHVGDGINVDSIKSNPQPTSRLRGFLDDGDDCFIVSEFYDLSLD